MEPRRYGHQESGRQKGRGGDKERGRNTPLRLLSSRAAGIVNPESKECVWVCSGPRIGLGTSLSRARAFDCRLFHRRTCVVCCLFVHSFALSAIPFLFVFGRDWLISSPRSIGTATLNTLLCVHLPPITRLSAGDLTRLTLWEFSSWGALRA